MNESIGFFGVPLTLDESYGRLAGNLDNLRDELKKQDNRSTAHPMYCVQVLNGIHWCTEQTFFTNKAAEDYIKLEKAYYEGELRIYIKSGQRNPEWCLIREFLHGNKEDT